MIFYFDDLCLSGDFELAEKCLQDLVLKDQNHPAALLNYAALLLCRYGSVIAGSSLKLTEFRLSNSSCSIWSLLQIY